MKPAADHSPGLERQWPAVAQAWQTVTGQSLWVAPDLQPAPDAEVPGELWQAAKEAAAPNCQAVSLRWQGQEWLALASQAAEPAFLLLTRRPDPAACAPEAATRLLEVLASLMDALAEDRTACNQLTAELLLAWNRLNFLFDMARIAAENDPLPKVFTRLAQSLLQVIFAADAFLLLESGSETPGPGSTPALVRMGAECWAEGWANGPVQVFTASGQSLPHLETLIPYARQTIPILILHAGRSLPPALAQGPIAVQNLVLLPMPLGADQHGLLGLINHPTGELRAADRQLLLSAVEQTGMLVTAALTRAMQEASRRMDHELTLASQIQSTFLPHRPPQFEGVDFAVNLQPAHLIGGDFYDLQPLQDGMAMMLGDVSGKGVPAAMLTALIHATLKSEVQHHRQPDDLLHSMNHLLYEELDRSAAFITAFLAVLGGPPLSLSYASAGHTTGLLWQAEQAEVRLLPSTGLPLGIDPELEIKHQHIPLAPGDVLVLYSDGITEAENDQGRVFGLQALIDLLLATHPAPAKQQLELILSALDIHRGARPLRDDVVLFVVRAASPETDAQQVLPFVFPAEKRAARTLALQARQLASTLPFSSAGGRSNFLNELELAVSEVASQVLENAYREYPIIGRIQGCLHLYADHIRLDLIDYGEGFPGTRALATSDGLIQQEAGYGLLIARRLLDVCQQHLLPNGRSLWRLEKRCKPS